MIKEVVNNWNKNKNKLEMYLSKTKQEEYSDYEDLLKVVVKIILPEFDYKNIRTNEFGEYQGINIFLIPTSIYPSLEEIIITHNYYGSCCGCDTLEYIKTASSNYGDGLPTKKQVGLYMQLCLNLIENMQQLKSIELNDK